MTLVDGLIPVTQLPTLMEVGSTDTIIGMLDRGNYVNFLPRFAVQESLLNESLFHIKIQSLRIKRALWIAHTR